MLSEDKIIGIFCLVDALLKGIGYHEDSRRKVSDSEVITTAIVSALYFGGHIDHGRHMMKMTGMIQQMLDKSRFCRLFKKITNDSSPESKIYDDSAYTDYTIEDDARQADLIELMIQRKSNSKRPDEPWIRFLKLQMRKGIETIFSMLKGLFLRKIHAVTFKGLLLKILMFIIGFIFNKLVIISNLNYLSLKYYGFGFLEYFRKKLH
jgi:hypothetical protein